ncbi:MAG: amidohydrolase, partial [Verrucomicrobia bacterium]|nr:amidohydrolase [Leptolyngbya sp. ES-bin-22]
MVSSLSPHPVDTTRIRAAIQTLQPELVAWRRQLHKKPELGFREQLTAAFIAQKLEEWGIEHQTGIAQTGIVAVIRGDRPGAVLG